MPDNTEYGIIIDTEQYAGNFERELCAYLTGRVGECGVGDEFTAENPLFIHVVDRPDEHGCYRPCEIYPTEGWFNNGLGGHFKDGQEALALKAYKEYRTKYTQEQIDQRKHIKEVLGRGEKYSNWTIEAADREIARLNLELSKALLETKVTKYPAYNSVLIHLTKPATQEQIDYIKEKIGGFHAAYKEQRSYRTSFEFTFVGIRTLQKKTTVETETVIE